MAFPVRSRRGRAGRFSALFTVLLALAYAPSLRAQALEILTVAVPEYDAAAAPYSVDLYATGGSGSYPTWGCAGLPAGLTCGGGANMGYITGTVSAGVTDGVYPVTVTVTDSLGASANASLPLRVYVAPQILTAVIPDGSLGDLYSPVRIRAVGGSPGLPIAVGAGALPPGLSLLSGEISGNPTQLGAFNFTLVYGAASRNFTVNVVRETAPNYWIRRGLSGGQMGALFFSPNFAQDRVVIALGKRTIHYSNDGGYFWRTLPFDLDYYFDNDYLPYSDTPTWVAFHNAFDGRTGSPYRAIAIATEYGGVFYLPDYLGYASYRVNSGLPTANGLVRAVRQVEFSPRFNVDQTLFARYEWSDPGGPPPHRELYAGTLTFTPDPSVQWNLVSQPGMSVFNFLTAATGLGKDLFLISYLGTAPDGLYRSQDAGGSWTRLAPVSYDIGHKPGVFTLSTNYLGDRTIAFADLGGVYVSQDAGDNWLLHPAIGAVAEMRLARLAGSTLRLYASSTNKTLAFSDDLGVSFTPAGTLGMTPADFSGRFAVSPDHLNDKTVIAIGAGDVGYYRSENGGVSWGPADGGLFAQTINQVVYAPDYATSGRIFVASNSGIFFTVNRGRTWRRASLPSGYSDPVLGLAISPDFAADQTLFAARGVTLLRSVDGGKTFAVRATLPQLFVETQRRDLIQLSPGYANDQTLFIRSGQGQLLRSTDRGATFAQQGWCPACGPSGRYLSATGFRVSPDYPNDHAVFVTEGDEGNYRSTDADAPSPTYAADGAIPLASLTRTGRAPAMFPDFSLSGGTPGTTSGTLLWHCARSTDLGATYTRVPDPASGYVSGCAQQEGDLYAAPPTAGDTTFPTIFSTVRIGDATGEFPGLYYSYDDGYTLNYHYPPGTAFEEIRSLAISPAYATTHEIIAGTDTGLWFGVVYAYGTIYWTQYLGDDPFGKDVVAAAADPNSFEGSFVANSYGMVFHSPDDGDTVNWLYEGWPAYPPTVFRLLAVGNPTALLAATSNGLWRRTDFSTAGSWTQVAGDALEFTDFTITDIGIHAACLSGPSLFTADLGQTWTPESGDETSLIAMDWNNAGSAAGPGRTLVGPRPATGSTAPLWSVAQYGGPRWSADGGATWTAAPGGNDYPAPPGQSWQIVRALGLNAASGAREVLAGSSTGLWKSNDGGETWRNAAGPGSGLELTSRNFTAALAATTPQGGTDLLVGASGAADGGVYLSGDGGEHWTQVNQGFDPNNLSISSLVKTSCAGCPVQYYSGTYGSGVYTRTITVNPPPAFPNAGKYCFAGACSTGSLNNCDNANRSGPANGGQPFKLCGTGFVAGAVVEFDGVPAVNCLVYSAFVIACGATPQHVPGNATVRVRNPDTRSGALPVNYQYTETGYAPRVASPIRVQRDGVTPDDLVVHWNCAPATCTLAAPARVWRAQNGAMTQFLEPFNGGVGGTPPADCSPLPGANDCLRQTGLAADANPRSYFWRVE